MDRQRYLQEEDWNIQQSSPSRIIISTSLVFEHHQDPPSMIYIPLMMQKEDENNNTWNFYSKNDNQSAPSANVKNKPKKMKITSLAYINRKRSRWKSRRASGCVLGQIRKRSRWKSRRAPGCVLSA
jgi:hypothetical protein